MFQSQDSNTDSIIDKDGYVHWSDLPPQTPQEQKALLNNSLWLGVSLAAVVWSLMLIILTGVYVVAVVRSGYA
mgnify:CR=1 FL=1